MALKVHHLRPAPGAKTAKTRVGRGEGRTKKAAEQEAAREALAKLDADGP